MSSPTPGRLAIVHRAWHQRAWVRISLILLLLITGWWGVSFWQNARDEQLLDEYLSELEKREPAWRERVYGKEATAAQFATRQTLYKLIQDLRGNASGWVPYREGLYQGMYIDPNQPAALLTPEQQEFLRWSESYWKPLLSQAHQMDNMVPLNRYVDRDAPSEKMLATVENDLINTWMLHELMELEVVNMLQQNQPEMAMIWLRRSLRLQKLRQELANIHQMESTPFLVERMLNLTQPNPETLRQLQQELELAAKLMEKEAYLQFGNEVRLKDKIVQEIQERSLVGRRMEQTGAFSNLISNDSVWNLETLEMLRPHYLKFKINSLYRRPYRIRLRLHQLADQMELLARLPPEKRWPSWKTFADANALTMQLPNYPDCKFPSSEAVPLGVHYLLPYFDLSILFTFQKEAQLKSALLAVAAERYRLDHGRFPPNSAALTPDYMAQPVWDPFTGKPFLFKLNEKGLVVYSLGHEGIDGGGDNLNGLHFWRYGGQKRNWGKNSNLGTRIFWPTFRRGVPVQLNEMQRAGLKKWVEFEKNREAGKEK